MAGCQFLIIFLAEFTSLITTTLIQYHSFQTLRQISNQFDKCVKRVHHHLLIRNLSCGKIWKHWQTLPSQTLMKMKKSNLVLCSSRLQRD